MMRLFRGSLLSVMLLTTASASEIPYQAALDAGTGYDFRVKAMNAGGVATSGSVTQTTLTAFKQWKQDNGIPLSGEDDADPDHDGMTNTQEYAFGTAPKTHPRSKPSSPPRHLPPARSPTAAASHL